MRNQIECTDITPQVSTLRDKLQIPLEYVFCGKKYPVYTPQVLVFQTPDDVSTFATSIIEAHLVDSSDSVTFPTGNTWKPMYRDMAKRSDVFTPLLQKRKSACLDEYVMKKSNPNYKAVSYVVYTDDLIGRPQNLGPENWIRPDGTDDNPWVAADRFEYELRQQGFSLYNLGIGPDAKTAKDEVLPPELTDSEIEEMVKKGNAIEASRHIGFIKLGTPPYCGATVIDLDRGTIFANNKKVPSPDNFPTQAITQGPGDILRADLRVIAATDRYKQRNIESVLFQSPDIVNPASMATLGKTVILLDAGAAGRTINRLKQEGLLS